MSVAKRALVTGGAGFIGRCLVRALLERDWQVAVLDDFSVGRIDDLEGLRGHAACEVVRADVADVRAVRTLVEAVQPAVVFHLAAIHFIPQCDRDPVKALETNVIGTQVVIDAVAALPGCRMVFPSTGDVYAPSAEPHGEQSAIGPPTLYGLTKSASEQLIGLAGERGLDYRIARVFNVFGPGDRTPHVLPDIVNGLLGGGTLALGPLHAVRDYVYVDDVVQALLALVHHDGKDRVFNIGTGEGRSVRDLVDAVAASWGSEVEVRTDPAKVRAIERRHLVCDARLAREVLGWTPRTSFREGIQRTVAAAMTCLA